ncbi:hypothetical protein HEP87_63350 [Streptomyces sp. S1D4-11]
MDAGRLSPQLSQPSDGGIALRLLLRSFRLTVCPLQLVAEGATDRGRAVRRVLVRRRLPLRELDA